MVLTPPEQPPPPPVFQPPDGGYGWIVCFACFWLNLFQAGIAMSHGVILNALISDFGEPHARVALLGSLLNGFLLGVGPIASFLVDRYGCRATSVLGSLLSSVAMSVSVFAPNLSVLIFTHGVVGGVGIGLTYLPSMIACNYYFVKRRALAVSIGVCGQGVGYAAVPPLASYVASFAGWQGVHVFFAILCGLGAFFGALFKPIKVLIYEEDTSNVIRCHERSPPAESSWTDNQQMSCRRNVSAIANFDYLGEKSNLPISNSVIIKNKNLSHLLPPTPLPTSSTVSLRVQTPIHCLHSARSSFTNIKALKTEDGKQGMGKVYSATVRPLAASDIFYTRSIPRLDQSVTRIQQPQNFKKQRDGEQFPRDDAKDPATPNFQDFEKSNPANSAPNIMIDRLPPLSEDSLECVEDKKTVWMKKLSFLFSPAYAVTCLANFLFFMVLGVPFAFGPDLLLKKGLCLDEETSSYMITCMGLANMLGQIGVGALADLPWVNSSVVSGLAMIVSGLSVSLMPNCQTYVQVMVASAFFGMSFAAVISLASIVLVDMFGLDSLTASIGLLVLVKGVAMSVGGPVTGSIYDALQSYDWCFYFAGVSSGAAGLLFLISLLAMRKIKCFS